MSDAERSRAEATSPRAAFVIFATLVLPLVLLAGCSQLEPAAPIEPVTDPTRLYLGLKLNHTAVNLTTDTTTPAFSTLQLVATPYDGTGAPIADAPAATFTSSDTLLLTATPDGVLHPHGTGNGIIVVADLAIGGVRYTDTAVVNILPSPQPMLDTLSLQVPIENAVWYRPTATTIGNSTEFIARNYAHLLPSSRLSLRTVDAGGQPIPGLTVEYVSLDPTVARVDRHLGSVTVISAGHVRIVARTIAFGVAKADTMVYTVQPPLAADVVADSFGFLSVTLTESPRVNLLRPDTSIVEIVAGGIVGWFRINAKEEEPTDVTFDDPTNVAAPPPAFCNVIAIFGVPCSEGNIPAFSGDLVGRWRYFPIAGTYPYHNSTTGAQGKIVVLERVPLP